MADIGPPHFIAVVEFDRRPKRLAHDVKPDGVDLIERHFAVHARSVEPFLEAVESDLADDGVEPVLDLAGEQCLFFVLGCGGDQVFEHQAFGEDRRRFRQSERCIGENRAQGLAQGLVHGMAELVRQGQDFAPITGEVEHDVGVAVRGHRVGVGARRLARAGRGVDPGLIKEDAGAVLEFRAHLGEGLQHDRLGFIPAIKSLHVLGKGGIAVPEIQLLLAEDLGLHGVIPMR